MPASGIAGRRQIRCGSRAGEISFPAAWSDNPHRNGMPMVPEVTLDGPANDHAGLSPPRIIR